YTDPVTRQRSWMTPAEADQAQHDYEVGLTEQRLPETVRLTEARRQALQEAAQSYEAQRNPMLYFDDSDFVWYLTGGNIDPDSSEGSNRVSQVRAALQEKFRGATPDVINTKLQQYVNAARIQQAKARDAADVIQPRT